MEGRKTPLISVIMGVLYRRSDLSLLARAVSSILGQSLGDFELLICDDGSTAEAQRYLEKQARNDGRIRLLRGCARTDLAAKLNFCLGAAKGAFIARMDDDDCSLPERFEKQVLYLNDHTEISFVGSSALLEQDGRPTVSGAAAGQRFYAGSALYPPNVALSARGFGGGRRILRSKALLWMRGL